MRIGLTFNLKPAGATGDRFEEFDSEETIVALERAIRSKGHSPVRLGWGEEMLDALERERVDGVFNLAEGIGGRGRESQVPAMLEMLGIPFTASSALSIGLTLDKALAKRVAQANGIATAPFLVVDPTDRVDPAKTHAPHPLPRSAREHPLPPGEGFERRSSREMPELQSLLPAGEGGPERSEGPDEGRAANRGSRFEVRGSSLGVRNDLNSHLAPRTSNLRFPLFCKPCNEGSSMGITAKSLCRDEAELEEAVERLSHYGPVLVEEFLSGDEYTVGIVDGQPIGVMQVVAKHETSEPFIYSVDVKRDYLNRVEYRFSRDRELEQVALDVWRAFDLRDVARVDIRRDRDGVPNFVEVNPLPGMNPVTSDLIILALGLGWKYDDLIGRVLDSAIRRWSA